MVNLMKSSKIYATIGLIVFAVLASPCAAAGNIYKYVDARGIVTYTNIKPRDPGIQVTDLGCYGRCAPAVDWRHVALNREAYAEAIGRLARDYAIDDALVRALIHVESGFDPRAVSRKGAQGLMQLMPAVQSEQGINDPFDPEENLSGGIAHLAALLVVFNGDVELALAAYNAGVEAVRKHDGIPPFEETREYVRRVDLLYRRYRQPASS